MSRTWWSRRRLLCYRLSICLWWMSRISRLGLLLLLVLPFPVGEVPRGLRPTSAQCWAMKRGRHVIDHVPSQIREHPCSCVCRAHGLPPAGPELVKRFAGKPWDPIEQPAARRASRTPELAVPVGPGFHPGRRHSLGRFRRDVSTASSSPTALQTEFSRDCTAQWHTRQYPPTTHQTISSPPGSMAYA